jgi:hypothetical protein
MTTALSIAMAAERQRHRDRTPRFEKPQEAALPARIKVTAAVPGAIYGYRTREH